MVISGIVIAIFCGLLLPQGLTNTILLTGIAAAMILIGGTEWKKCLRSEPYSRFLWDAWWHTSFSAPPTTRIPS